MLKWVVAAMVAALAGAMVLASAQSSGEQPLVRLRNRGIAELENEKPALAEATFEQLTRIAPKDPLGWANLAIARLRQQDFEGAEAALGKAFEIAPGDARLLAIGGEIAQWSGHPEPALASFRAAAAAAPDDRELQYALYRQATITQGDEADDAARQALERLARLRPENLVVLLQLGQKGRAAGDRAQATAAFLRVRELIWQAPPGADRLLDQVIEGLEAGDLDAVRVPAQRLENVLKITAMYRESLRELASGIQGIPLAALADEPPIDSFGAAAEVRFETRRIGDETVLDVKTGDFDGDAAPDILSLVDGDTRRLRLGPGAGEAPASEFDANGIERLLVLDLDNDGRLDVLGYGGERLAFWRNSDDGLVLATAEMGLDQTAAAAVTAIDFDIEGDLDLFTASAGAELYRNALSGPLEPVGSKSLPPLDLAAASDVIASDLDRDGDLDLLIAHDAGLSWLDNLRQGRFAAGAELGVAPRLRRLAVADFDNDGFPDLAGVGRGAGLWRNAGGRLEEFPMAATLASSAEMAALAVLDADNDGRLDLAVGGDGGLAIAAQKRTGELSFLPIDGSPRGILALAAADLDRDGDQDLLAAGTDGLFRLENHGGNANHWLQVRLRGLDKGNSKNNVYGLGSSLEIRAGSAYQFREATGDVVHFGLGKVETPDLLRVVWTNGVPQNRLEPTANQWIVEEQLLKGSCPFLYTWTGEGFEFATDLLWGAPIGLPAGEGKWVGSDPEELVEIERLEPREGRYELRITEELWEAAFFDSTRLWIVDHPADLEVASSLKIVPGQVVIDRVLASRNLRPVAAAWDAAGRDVTDRVSRRDEIYADGWRRSSYQGVAERPWEFTIELGEAPGRPVRLHLDGWIFPTDASLNLALDQRHDLAPMAPSLEVETADGWQTLIPNMGFPAGKTKTMVVDTPPLPAAATRLRIVSSQWLSWDRIVWTTSTRDDTPIVQARLEPDTAELRFRGFSRLVRQAPNAPHSFDYARVQSESPWIPFPGRYTRYGDVRELLAAVDDRSVILGPGDEMAVTFDAAELPPLAAGWRRAVFLESHGWDKDADRNTGAGLGVEPLPFRAMSGYPYGAGEAFPDSPLHREYLDRWLTRIVEAPAIGRWKTAK